MNRTASPREAFGEALVELGRENKNVVVLDADVAPATRTELFKNAFPDRFIEGGVAEQNLMGVAAGLATVGKIPFVATFGVFTSQRAADQLIISIAYPRCNVKIVGLYSGLCGVKNGVTHQTYSDIAFIRTVPNIILVEPGDAIEVKQVIKVIAYYEGPVYLRLGRDPIPVVFNENYTFSLGKAVTLREGKEVTIITSGVMLSYALKAEEELQRQGIDVRFIHMPTLKPIDKGVIIKAAKETGAIVTVENHSIFGGLGGTVAEVTSGRFPVPIERVGIRDIFAESGYFEELIEKYQISTPHIVEAVKRVLKRK